jgi:hypothetical protein
MSARWSNAKSAGAFQRTSGCTYNEKLFRTLKCILQPSGQRPDKTATGTAEELHVQATYSSALTRFLISRRAAETVPAHVCWLSKTHGSFQSLPCWSIGLQRRGD